MKKNLTTLLLVIAAVITPIGTWAQQARITHLTITVDGVTYSKGDTAIITPETQSISYTVYGENFANLTENHMVTYAAAAADRLTDSGWEINTQDNIATYDASGDLRFFVYNDPAKPVRYSHDGFETYETTDLYVWYKTPKAIITHLSLTVDGVTYSKGDTAVITPETQSIIYTVTGENFANLTQDHYVDLTAGVSCSLLSEAIIDTEKNTATLDMSGSLYYYQSLSTPFELRYSNDGSTWIKSGVKIMYDDGLSEEERAVITEVTITLDGIVYGAGDTAIVTPQTTSIIYTVTGERFKNFTNHTVRTTPKGSVSLTSGWWIIDTESNSATFNMSSRLDEYQAITTPFEVIYSNDGQQTWINSSLFVVYDDGEEEKEAVITGMSVIVDDVEYGVGDTAVITPNSQKMLIKVMGENFKYLSEKNAIFDGFSSCDMSSMYSWTIDTENNTAIFDNTAWISSYQLLTTAVELEYSNDGYQSWTNSGVYVMYDDGLSEGEETVITSLTVTVDGVTYSAGDTAVVTPQSISIIYTVTGERFENLSNHLVELIPGTSSSLLSGWWDIDTENNTATLDMSSELSAYQFITSPYELRYSNDGQQTWINSGVFVVYDDGTTTALGELPVASSESKKALRNGRLVIIRDGVEYDITGSRL